MSVGDPLNKIFFDNTSGSSAILDQVVNHIKNFTDNGQGIQGHIKNTIEFGREKMIQFQVVQHFLTELEKELPSIDSLEQTERWISNYQNYWATLPDRWYDSIKELLTEQSYVIATHSQSETVKSVVLKMHQDNYSLKICQTQSAPANEGELQANWLANKGIEVILTTEALFTKCIESSDLVILGCDGVYSDGFVNKAGTHGICLIAKAFSKPVYVIADSRKMSDMPSSPEQIKPSGEVSVRTHPNLEVINYYFELIPHNCITGYITESGILEEDSV